MLKFSVGAAHNATKWHVKEVQTWKEFLHDHLMANAKALPMKREAFAKLSKEERNKLKDIGGFTGGPFKRGERRLENLEEMYLLILDADSLVINSEQSGPEEERLFLRRVAQVLKTTQYVYYRTANYTESAPRFRIVMPLDQPISPELYTTVCQNVAEAIDGDRETSYFDPSGFIANHMMYWPIFFEGEDVPNSPARPKSHANGLPLTVESFSLVRENSKWSGTGLGVMGNPYEKPGLVGAWCRRYDVHDVLRMCAEDNLSPYTAAGGGRYIFEDSETGMPGARAWGEGDTAMFFTSSHANDPIASQGIRAVNAFDLMRILRFGHLDAKHKGDVLKTPSRIAMMAYAKEDREVVLEHTNGKLRAPLEGELLEETFDIAEVTEEEKRVISRPETEILPAQAEFAPAGSPEWCAYMKSGMQLDPKGRFLPTQSNLFTLMWVDSALRDGLLGWDEFANKKLKNPRALAMTGQHGWVPLKRTPQGYVIDPKKIQQLPETALWSDADDAILKGYLAEKCDGQAPRDVTYHDALTQFNLMKKHHPVQEYLEGLEWDGTPRLDRLAIDFLAADDTELNRMCMRKHLIAACARIMQPGCKHDLMLVFVGPQGGGKTTFVQRLAKNPNWFNGSLEATHSSKDDVEATDGRWLVLMDEMTGMTKMDANRLKKFLTETHTHTRLAYGRNTTLYTRQCVFFGTSNKSDFLVDTTGNRRFWPIKVKMNDFCTKRIFGDYTDADVAAEEKRLGRKLRPEELTTLTPEYVDQVWAEAMAAYLSKENWKLPVHLDKEIEKIQEDHRETDAWEDLIRNYVERGRPADWNQKTPSERFTWLNEAKNTGTEEIVYLSTSEVLSECLNLVPKDYTMQIKRRVNNIINMLGFTQKKRRGNKSIAFNGQDAWFKED